MNRSRYFLTVFLLAASLVFCGFGVNVSVAKGKNKSGYSEDVKAMNERHQAEMNELKERYKQDSRSVTATKKREKKLVERG